MPRGSVGSPSTGLTVFCPRRGISVLLVSVYDCDVRTTARFLPPPEVLFSVMKLRFRGLHLRLQQLTHSAIPPPPYRFGPDLTPPTPRLPPPGSRRSDGSQVEPHAAFPL